MSRNQMAELVKYATGVFVCTEEKAVPQRVVSALYRTFHRLTVSFAPFPLGRGVWGVRPRLALCVGSSPSLN